MRAFKKVHLLQHLFLLSLIFLTSSDSEDALTIRTICGKIPIQEPLNHMLVCRSQKLYYRTSLGLFPISSVNYTAKPFTISHPSCSHSTHSLSPSILSAGFFPKPQHFPNSLVLFNCSRASELDQHLSTFTRSYTCPKACETPSKVEGKQINNYNTFSNCFLIDDLEKLDHIGFHPRDLNCTHYRRVYRQSFEDRNEDKFEGFEFGTRISFDIPDHVPNICNECEKPNGNCGVGLRCICHPKECKDKVISKGTESFKAVGNILVFLASFLLVTIV